MQITLPPQIERDLTSARAALHLAIGLFLAEEVTLGQAAEVAGLSQAEFMRELGRRRIPTHYGREEFAEDLAMLREVPLIAPLISDLQTQAGCWFDDALVAEVLRAAGEG